MDYENAPQEGAAQPKGEAGRPPFEPTKFHRDLVKHCKASGMIHKDICQLIQWPDGTPISVSTLERYFRDELDRGLPEAIAKMSSKLFQKGIDGDVTCMIFWLKSRARWKETVAHELTGADGEPLPAPTLADMYQSIQMVKSTAQPEDDGSQPAADAVPGAEGPSP